MFPYFDDLRDEPMGRLLGGSYELLLGRRTYEIFAARGPTTATSQSARRSMPFESTS